MFNMDKLNVYYLDTETKPELSEDDKKEKRVIALTPYEFMVYEMLDRIANILRGSK